MRNKTTNIYTEWLPLIEGMKNEQAGLIFKAILQYQNGAEISSQNPVWLFIKSKIDEYNSAGNEISERRRIAGKLGGLAKASNAKQRLAMLSKSSNKIKENKIKENNLNSYGEFGCVHLTAELYNQYLSRFGEAKLAYGIEKLDEWLAKPNQKDKRAGDHYGYFKNNSWIFDGFVEQTSNWSDL